MKKDSIFDDPWWGRKANNNKRIHKQLLTCSGHWTNLVHHNRHTLTSAADILSPNISPSVPFILWPDLKLVSIQPSLIVSLQCCILCCCCCFSGALQFHIASYYVLNAVFSNHSLLMGFPIAFFAYTVVFTLISVIQCSCIYTVHLFTGGN